MSTRFLRSGMDNLTLHQRGCPRCNWLARILRKAKPWRWADDQNDVVIVKAIRAMHMRPCRVCHPFVKGEIT